MICPQCSSVVIIQKPDKVENGIRYYFHQCLRCNAEIIITVTVKTEGNAELVKKYKDWLNQDNI